MSEAARLLVRLMTEHLMCFGFDPAPELIDAIRGALEHGLSAADFWTCFYSVDADRRRGVSFPKSGGVDEEIVVRMRKMYREKLCEGVKKQGG